MSAARTPTIEDQKRVWLARVLGVRLGAERDPRMDGPPDNGSPETNLEDAMADWRRARARVSSPLRRLSKAIAATGESDADRLVILLQAIIKNLSAEPACLSAVVELDRYLRTDDIIEDAETPNPFGIDVAIRAPLLEALAQLAQHFKAAGRT
jgi:hypothetical protein